MIFLNTAKSGSVRIGNSSRSLWRSGKSENRDIDRQVAQTFHQYRSHFFDDTQFRIGGISLQTLLYSSASDKAQRLE